MALVWQPNQKRVPTVGRVFSLPFFDELLFVFFNLSA